MCYFITGIFLMNALGCIFIYQHILQILALKEYKLF